MTQRRNLVAPLLAAIVILLSVQVVGWASSDKEEPKPQPAIESRQAVSMHIIGEDIRGMWIYRMWSDGTLEVTKVTGWGERIPWEEIKEKSPE